MIVGVFIVGLLAIKVWLEVCDMGILSKSFFLLTLPFVIMALLFMMPETDITKSSWAKFPFPLYTMHPFGLCVVNGLMGIAGIRVMVQHSLCLSATVSFGVVLMLFAVMKVTRRVSWLSSLLYGGR